MSYIQTNSTAVVVEVNEVSLLHFRVIFLRPQPLGDERSHNTTTDIQKQGTLTRKFNLNLEKKIIWLS